MFVAKQWKGDPCESDEMLPQWFHTKEIPFDKMWIDDEHWLPLVLDKKKVKAEFTFTSDGSQILDKKIEAN